MEDEEDEEDGKDGEDEEDEALGGEEENLFHTRSIKFSDFYVYINCRQRSCWNTVSKSGVLPCQRGWPSFLCSKWTFKILLTSSFSRLIFDLAVNLNEYSKPRNASSCWGG